MYTNYIIAGIILAVVVYLFLKARARMKNIPMVTDHENILTLTEGNFQHQTKNKLVLVDFWASWCAPCRAMAPVLNDVAEKLNGNSHVGKVNIEQHQSLAQKVQSKKHTYPHPFKKRSRGEAICGYEGQGLPSYPDSQHEIITSYF